MHSLHKSLKQNFARFVYRFRFKFWPYFQHKRLLYPKKEEKYFNIALGLYPLIGFYELTDKGYFPLDARGITHREARIGLPNESLQLSDYNASGICHYALGLLEKFDSTNDIAILEEVKKQADFIICNSVTGYHNGFDFRYWKYPFPQGTGMSGMSQGLVLSVLLRCHQIFGDDTYIREANLYAKSYRVPLEKGGFVYRNREEIIFEEYPKDRKKKHVLNGWIYSLIGLMEYVQLVPMESDLKRLLEMSLVTLAFRCADYDFGFWNLYNLPKSLSNIASITYHSVHVSMMDRLMPGGIYRILAEKWNHTFLSYNCRFRAFLLKLVVVNL